MSALAKMVSISEAVELIKAGKCLSIAGDESALRQLPQGSWIGGTSPYFMTEEGGVATREKLFVHVIPTYDEPPVLRAYDIESLSQICRNAPEQGFSIVIMPAFSECHQAFAQNAPSYEEMYMKPLAGWVAGMHLDDLGKVKPQVVLGSIGKFSETDVVVMDVPLPADAFANVDIVNLFRPGDGDVITFSQVGFVASECCVNGQPANLAQYLSGLGTDKRLPLVADYCGAFINVGIKSVDTVSGHVEFYAPVFADTAYRIAAPVADYVTSFQAALPEVSDGIVFSCNCILNYLYSDLEGKRTGTITGPITFGEIGYQLLNQTLVYLSVLR